MKEKYLKYLPSKKFILTLVGFVILGIIIFLIFFMSSSGENFLVGNKENNNNNLKVENKTLTELIENDTDGDSIPDWEEALWGTDKNKKITFNNTPDVTYIENKKKELKIEQSINEKNLTETEKFAREFFTSYTAMKSSGQIDANTINDFSNALGQKIVNPNLIDRYIESDIKINNDDTTTKKFEYYSNMQKLFNKYQSVGIGDELGIISDGLEADSSIETNNSADKYKKLSVIADAYQNFAKKIMEMSVPQSLSDYHLRIANSANNTGISVLNMGKIISDPIIGLSGLSQYQKYSDDLVNAVTDLETALSQ